ncbi:MAG: hypothetical protein KC619_02835, partial [Myxococcales bacterium]|nr:hypothetical protein [Myxococcales bacterium]
MGYDVAVYGTLRVPKKAMAAWRAGTADPGAHDDWGSLGGADPTAHPITTALERMGALAELSEGDGEIRVEGLLSEDLYIDHARVWAAAFRAAAPLGGKGSLTFLAIEGARFGHRLEVAPKGSRIAELDEAGLGAAERSPEVARIELKMDALLTEALATPPRKKATKKKAAKKGATKAARSRDELIAATREGKSKDRSTALTELAALDPRAAESIALEWLQELGEDNWREAVLRTMNALDLLPEIVQPEGIAILCREALRRGSTGVDEQIFEVLGRCTHPDTAAIVASQITHEAIAESVGQ